MTTQGLRPVTVVERGEIHVVELHGDIDSQALAALDSDVAAALAAGSRAIVIDLRDVAFVASSIVNAIFRVCRRVREAVGTMAVVCTDAHALRVIELTSLDQAVAVCATVEDAVRSVSPE